MTSIVYLGGEKMSSELLERLAKLYSSVVADALDGMGLRFQVMAPRIRPLYPEAELVGYAFPVQAEETTRLSPEPYKRELWAVDAVRPDHVIVVGGAGQRGALWGELLSTRAKMRGSRGAVIDGLTRDSRLIMAMKFPVFISGISPADSHGRVDILAHDVKVKCAGVEVNPGDLVIADYDGVVVIPKDVAEEAIEKAEEKGRLEDAVREELMRGVSVRDTYDKYGVI